MRTIILILINFLAARNILALPVQAEAIISDPAPYIYQTVVYMVRIMSQNKVREFNPTPPTISGAALELLERQPRYYTRSALFIYEYCYALTPLIAGRITIPVMPISGATEDQYQSGAGQADNSFQVRAPAIIIQARPMPNNATQPWLPLQNLELISAGELQHAQRGEPFTLQLWLRAIGARGARLPVLVNFLQGQDFRVYAEQPVDYWQDATTSGNAIRGQRHEILTVVPLRAGKLRLPAIKINWWDTAQDQPQNLEWQAPEIDVIAEPLPTRNFTNIFLGLGAALIFLSGWGIGIIKLRKTLIFTLILQHLSRFVQTINLRPKIINLFLFWVKSLSPIISFVQSLRVAWPGLLSRVLPGSFHKQQLFHRINAATNAREIAAALQIYAHNILALAPNSPLIRIGELLINAQPELINSPLMPLLHELDAALYGMRDETPELDIARWQKQFRSISFRNLPRHSGSFNYLPPLNHN